MRERNLKQVDILNKTLPFQTKYNVRLAKNDLSQYVNGKVEPNQERVYILAKALDVSEAWLLGYDVPKQRVNKNDNEDITTIYNQLNNDRQKKVYNFAEHQLEEQQRVKPTVYVISKLSAGTGIIDLDPTDTEEVEFDGYVPAHDLAFEVAGDSMTPMFKDGEIVFVEKTQDIRSGQIIAVQINEEAYIKKAYIEDNRLRLVSLNKEYKDIYADENDDIRVVGRVIL